MQRLRSRNLIAEAREAEFQEFLAKERESIGYPERIVRPNTLAKILGVNRATLKLWRSKGWIIQPLRFNQSQKALGWKMSDVKSMVDGLVRCGAAGGSV